MVHSVVFVRFGRERGIYLFIGFQRAGDGTLGKPFVLSRFSFSTVVNANNYFEHYKHKM